MKNTDVSSVISQVNDLLLKCNTILCHSGIMDNAEKKYGFKLRLIKIGCYQIRYKDPDSNKWIIKKIILANNDELAKLYAIENKDEIIQRFKENKTIRKTQNDGIGFYKMLNDYYQKDSIYLKDDKANKKRDVVQRQRIKFNGFIRNYLIPYLESKNVNNIQDINNIVYSGFVAPTLNLHK